MSDIIQSSPGALDRRGPGKAPRGSRARHANRGPGRGTTGQRQRPPGKAAPSTIAKPPAGFLDLPGEVRNSIYELVLLFHDPIYPWSGHDRQEKITTSIFRTSKAVHSEASSLFYGHNRFYFGLVVSQTVVSFFEQIGSNNAGYIRHIDIGALDFDKRDPNSIALAKDSDDTLATIKSSCLTLKTLTMSINASSLFEDENRLYDLQSNKVVNKVLELVDTRIRAGSSLQEPIIEVFSDSWSDNPLSDHIGGIMRSLGWAVIIIESDEEEENDEEEDEAGGSNEDYISDYLDAGGYGDDGDGDFGDHDDEFWERAEAAIYGNM
ncbi:hypothetical protein CONLIGDRAFT_623468 [Coniochaeta ligniaria NRRL 30616]|uniref:Uncharacterized protein n=1 Tax=Coniochaeta ligniaria NRRL 30616 TaxID=1408157 RepID=A0A1J7IAT2_9PEZI|nr:hypothetical protein CONLIGDRAFT_623468 [Coniochaeta ligniaria NRRL 30616]